MGAEKGLDFGQRAGKILLVRIEPRENVSGRSLPGAVNGVVHTGVGLADRPQVGLAGQPLGCTICRLRVLHQVLQGRVALTAHRAYAAGELGERIVGRRRDGKAGRAHGWPAEVE